MATHLASYGVLSYDVLMPKHLLLALLVFSAGASSAINVEQYKQARAGDANVNNQLESFLAGISRGFVYANVQLGLANSPKFYCQPPTLGLNAGNIVQLVEGELIRDPAIRNDFPIEFVVMGALKRAFPCK